MPATSACVRRASRSAGLEGGVVVPEEDRDLRRGIDVGRVRCQPDHLDPIELLEEAARQVVRLDLVLGGGVVQRRDRVRRWRVGLILRRSVDPDRPLAEYGMDSLGALELRTRIESETGIRISPKDMTTTIRDLAGQLCEALTPVEAA